MTPAIRYAASEFRGAIASKVNAGRKSKRKQRSSHSLSTWVVRQPPGIHWCLSPTSAILTPAVGALLLETPYFFTQDPLKSKKGSVFYGLLYLWISKQMVTRQGFLRDR